MLINDVLYKQPSEETLAKALGLLADEPPTLTVEKEARGCCELRLKIEGMG